MMKDAVTLLSGGMDSAVATLLAKKYCKIKLALTFDYAQKAALQEIRAARRFCKYYKIKHAVVKLPWLASISRGPLTSQKHALPQFKISDLKNIRKTRKSAAAVWVPNRNAAFANIAVSYAEALNCNVIVAGFNAEEASTFPDNSKSFIDALNRLFRHSTLIAAKIISPTIQMTKCEIANNSIKLKLSPRFFWSCYRGGTKMCGRCESCVRTIRAFKTIGDWELIKNSFEISKLKT